MIAWSIVIVVAVVLSLLATASLRVLREYERAVVFRLGRLRGAHGPGLLTLIPFVDRIERVSLRTVTLTIPPQEVITRDNVPARVNAVAYFRVTDPVRAIVEVEAYPVATSQIAQTTLRSVLGHVDLDTLLAEREELNENLRKIVDEQTEPWGIKVTTVEIKDVEIPEAMQRAMARQAEAERERRAKVINALGEFEAAESLYDASKILSRSPSALQLRYLQTLLEIGNDQRTTVVFPFPMDLVEPFLGRTNGSKPADATSLAGDGAVLSGSGDQGRFSPLRTADPVKPVPDGGNSVNRLGQIGDGQGEGQAQETLECSVQTESGPGGEPYPDLLGGAGQRAGDWSVQLGPERDAAARYDDPPVRQPIGERSEQGIPLPD